MEHVTLDQVNTPAEVCFTFNQLIEEVNRLSAVVAPIEQKRNERLAKEKLQAEKKQQKAEKAKAAEEAEGIAAAIAENEAKKKAEAEARAVLKQKEAALQKPEAIDAINKAKNAAMAEEGATAESIGKAIADAKEKIWQQIQLGEPVEAAEGSNKL